MSTLSTVSAHDGAVLVLEDGTRYTGRAYGARGRTVGEAVFATGMTGYQETLTDPSYAGQIVVQTAPHIGNTGVNDEDPESRRIWVAGYVVRDPSRIVSNFRATRSLDADLVGVGRATWTIDRAVGNAGLVFVRFRLGSAEVDSYLRPDDPAALVEAIEALLPADKKEAA